MRQVDQARALAGRGLDGDRYAAKAAEFRDDVAEFGSTAVDNLRTVLTHLLAQIDLPGIREQIVHEIQQVFDGKVVWVEDLMRLGINGARESTIEQRQG